MSVQAINIEQVKKLIDEQTVTVADIRDPQSYQAAHIEDAVQINDSNVQEFVASADKTKPLLVYCYHGHSSQSAAEYFTTMGFTDVYSMDGGFEAWRMKYSS